MAAMEKPHVIGDALHHATSSAGSRIGYIYQGREISFSQIDEMSDRFATGLLQLGYQKGDCLGIISLNSPKWLVAYFAAAKIGVIVVGLNVRYRDSELDYMINQSQIRGIVCIDGITDMDYVSFFSAFRQKIPTVQDLIFIGSRRSSDSIAFDDLLDTAVNQSLLDTAKGLVTPEDLMMIIYTSGTTGQPKGAAITHKSQLSAASTQADYCKITADDVTPLALPFNHVGGITCGMLANLLKQAVSVILPSFSPAMFIEQCKRHQVTRVGGVPMMHTLVISHPDFPSWDTDTVTSVMTGGSNANPDLLTKMYQAYPNATIMNLYGLSEVSGAMIMSPWGSTFDQTISSIGKPLPGFQAKVIDGQGHQVAPGDSGELCLKGGAVAAGYYRMPNETAKAFTSDGWLHTGDIAYIDSEGYIILMGRIKEMYIQGGYNVYPVEVENLLAKHPKVMMVAGIGIPDTILGEVGRYYIIPTADNTPSQEELISYCREHLANYKIPKQFVFRKELPLTPAGKVMKARLKKEWKDGVGWSKVGGQ